MLRYSSLYPNHVHQLTVCASKHYYVTRDGRLKYQHKPMEIRLDNVTQDERTHLVHYLLRDHYSGLFFAEVATSDRLMPVEQFLARAWSRKSDCVFCGIPDLLAVPMTVEAFFPTVRKSVAELGIRFLEVTSGFQAGVRDIRTVEGYVALACGEPIENASLRASQITRVNAERKSSHGLEDKASLWLGRVPPVRLPPERWGREA